MIDAIVSTTDFQKKRCSTLRSFFFIYFRWETLTWPRRPFEIVIFHGKTDKWSAHTCTQTHTNAMRISRSAQRQHKNVCDGLHISECTIKRKRKNKKKIENFKRKKQTESDERKENEWDEQRRRRRQRERDTQRFTCLNASHSTRSTWSGWHFACVGLFDDQQVNSYDYDVVVSTHT